ncbi:unnamed protein product [Pleuronectes platessa]|uniref:Uncharacterized protein n=1 Tax=Pleuronectes platessa TaxID=8262 RepID=A0A9N7YBI3_PLEPL|nr:unnamed protein product [Pleuronectes platessa]
MKTNSPRGELRDAKLAASNRGRTGSEWITPSTIKAPPTLTDCRTVSAPSLEAVTPAVLGVSSAGLAVAALPIGSQLKEGLCGALRWWMLYNDITQQTNRSITMTNPVYWAVLVGMTVLLMEQGDEPQARFAGGLRQLAEQKDAVQTLQQSFLAETLAGLCIVPLSFLHQSVSAKDENYSWLDRNLEQQLFLDDQLRERRWIGVVFMFMRT